MKENMVPPTYSDEQLLRDPAKYLEWRRSSSWNFRRGWGLFVRSRVWEDFWFIPMLLAYALFVVATAVAVVTITLLALAAVPFFKAFRWLKRAWNTGY